MGICEDCAAEEYELEEFQETPFPSYLLLGAVFGAIPAIFTGSILFVHAGVIAGTATEVIRCYKCGKDEDVYEIIEEKEDELGHKTYNRMPFRLYEDVESLDDQFTLEEASKQYVWDETEGHLMLIQDADNSPEVNISPDYEVSFEADAQLDAGSFDFDMGDFGEGGESGGFGSGEMGGDSGGSDFGGGSGGCD